MGQMIIDRGDDGLNPEGVSYENTYVIPSGFRFVHAISTILPSLRDCGDSKFAAILYQFPRQRQRLVTRGDFADCLTFTDRLEQLTDDSARV